MEIFQKHGTNKMKTLKQQIFELTAKHTFEQFAESISCGVKHNACISKRNFISFDCKTIYEVKQLLSTLSPTNKTSVIGTATDKFYKTIDSPYKITIDNPASTNQYNWFSLRIQFELNDIDIWINVPLNLITFYNFVRITRNITDSEYHYFIGMSNKQLREMKVTAYNFNNNYVVNFYGGSKTLFCGIEANNIINGILNQ